MSAKVRIAAFRPMTAQLPIVYGSIPHLRYLERTFEAVLQIVPQVMCTLTFIPHTNGIFITSNRDEAVLRKAALPPQPYTVNGRTIVFPKDGQAGGTWVGTNDAGHVMVLLNGAYERHEMGGSYRKSRGQIFLDILSAPHPFDAFRDIDLDRIEPFMLVLWAEGQLWDLRWDGARKYQTQEDPAVTHIWSSAQLYTPEVRARREAWFAEWQSERDMQQVTIADVTRFHTFGGNREDDENKLVMHRGDFLKTISITAINWTPDAVSMHYHDLMQDTWSVAELDVAHQDKGR